MKEASEYTGAYVLSMVRAHYPLINLKRLEARYPKEVDPDKAEELQTAQLDLSKIIGDINYVEVGQHLYRVRHRQVS